MKYKPEHEMIYQELEKKLNTIKVKRPQLSSVAYATDFGVKAGDGFCNTKAFARAIDYCRENNISTLKIPKGIYHFKECLGKAHLILDNMQNFFLDGQGSELIFESLKSYISICNSQQIQVANLILDWNWEKAPLASVGIISSIANDGSHIDCLFPSCSEVPEEMDIRIVGPFDAGRYTPGCKGGIEFRPYANEHVILTDDQGADSKMQELVRELSNVFQHRHEKIAPSLLRFYTVDSGFVKANFHIGDAFNFRHFEYDILTIPIEDSTDCTLEEITIYSSPGSGFVGNGDISGIHFKRCKVAMRPGTNRSITTATDCLHVCNSQGNFIIEDCEFGHAGDDCINIHDNSSMGIEVLDNNTIIAKRVVKRQVLFEVGYPVELRNEDLSEVGFVSDIVAVCYDEEAHTCKLTFADDLPSGLSQSTVIWNKRFQTQNYIIRNCRFYNNRARGVLLQGSNGILENNIFENIQGAAIQIETGCESRWSEGHGVENLIIRNNVIRHCDLNAWQMAVLYMGVYLPGGRTEVPVFKNILIEHNSFIDCPRLAMYLSSCEGIIVRKNTIINAGQVPLQDPSYGSSTLEEPIYGEKYHGIIQFEKAIDCVEEENSIVSFLLK